MITITKEFINALQEVLKEEIRTYKTVELKLTDKKKHLVEGNTEGLSTVDKELLALARRAKTLEKQRITVMEQTGVRELTLTQLIEQTEPVISKPLLDSRTALIKLMKSIKRLNENNEQLLNLSVKWVRDSVDVIATAISPEGAAYGKDGPKSGPQKQDLNLPRGSSTVERTA